MILAAPNILQCPHCGGLSTISAIRSGNSMGMVEWSDSKRYAPMLPRPSAVQRCPSCMQYFFLNRALVVGSCKSFFTPGSWGHLSYTSLKEALEELQPTGEEEILLRTLILQGYNDLYGGCHGTKHPSEAPAEERHYFEQNAKRLIELIPEKKVFCAELLRELGEFEKAIALLNDIIADDETTPIVLQIKERTLNHDQAVFVLDNDLATDCQRTPFDERTLYVYDPTTDERGIGNFKDDVLDYLHKTTD